MKKLLIFLLLILLAWSPWITKSFAENLVNTKFEEKWKNYPDGCGFNCDGCGITNSFKFFFGYIVNIEYSCGMLPDRNEFHKTDSFFVSLFGSVHEI